MLVQPVPNQAFIPLSKIGVDVQAYAANLTTWSGIAPGTGVAAALAANVGIAGAFVVNGGALGTPSSGTLTSCTGLPVMTGISGLGPGIPTFLATPSSANLFASMNDKSGLGLLVFNNSCQLVNPNINTMNSSTDFTHTQNSVSVMTSVNLGAIVDTLYLKAGNVGIGMTAPAAKLDVTQSTAGTTGINLSHTAITGTNYGVMATVTGAATVNTGFYVNVSSASNNFGVRIVAPTVGANNYAIYADGTAQNYFAGKVGIGLTSPSYYLQVGIDSAAKPSTNTWTITSDSRLKSDIQIADLNRCYEIVKSLPLKRFKWKDNVYTTEQVNDRAKLGWIAQDVEPFFKKAVSIHKQELLTFVENTVEEEMADTIEQQVVDTTMEIIEIGGRFVQKAVATARTKTVALYEPEAQLYDELGNPVRDNSGKFVKYSKPKMKKVLKTTKKFDVINDCYGMNADQIYAAMYGAVQKLISKVEAIEAKIP